MSKKLPKIIVILGPTASGKTKLSLKLAREFNGEIISADSRLIYKGMDIGSCKPTKKQQRPIRHHLIDIARPDQVVTLTAWQRAAFRNIDAILKKKKLPFLVGGTGLYISSIIENYRIPQTKGRPRYDALTIGIAVPRGRLYRTINARVTALIRAGLEREVRQLAKKYSWSWPSMHGIGYREWQSYFNGEQSKKDTIAAIQQATRNFAKRQMTWFRGMERRHPIHWVTTPSTAERIIKDFLT